MTFRQWQLTHAASDPDRLERLQIRWFAIGCRTLKDDLTHVQNNIRSIIEGPLRRLIINLSDEILTLGAES